MIGKRTVLVLGAGASADYGFPIGETLKTMVQRILREPLSDTHRVLVGMGFKTSDQEACSEALRRSGDQTVDGFLEARPDMRQIGKAAIAAVLIGGEREGILFDAEQNWYKHLWGRWATPSIDTFDTQRFAFITFNYDRSLEVFLYNSVKYHYGLYGGTAAADMLNALTVIHVHGRLGDLPWQKEGRPYEPDPTADNLHKAAGGIKVTSEGFFNGFLEGEAAQTLAGAGRVIFLGFGYGEANIRQLPLSLNGRGQDFLHGSCYGLGERDRRRVEDFFRPGFINFGDPKQKVLDYLMQSEVV